MTPILTKRQLYITIARIRRYFGISADSYPIDLMELVKSIGCVKIGYVPFRTRGLRGMLSVSRVPKEPHIILLNAGRARLENEFTCGHELMHLLLHARKPESGFQCFDSLDVHRDPYAEWQANEGAAELKLPYIQVIGGFIDMCLFSAPDGRRSRSIQEDLARRFEVSEVVMGNRLLSLSHEIMQSVESAISWREEPVEVISHHRQAELGTVRYSNVMELICAVQKKAGEAMTGDARERRLYEERELAKREFSRAEQFHELELERDWEQLFN